jgi:hypothetical protein
MMPVSMKFVVALMLHSILRIFSDDTTGGSSGASSQRNLCKVHSTEDAKWNVSILSVHLAHEILVNETLLAGVSYNDSRVVQSRYVSEGVDDCGVTFFGIYT